MSATNKWLQDMQTLKANTNLLRTELNSAGVSVSNTDTLQTLVGKVPQIQTVEYENAWKPDSLWKFPDPNGTQTTKTIREIYDEDTTTGYTYRGIYQIRGDLDTFDLKASVNASSSAYTFILSDGTTYTDITATTLEHTWDTTKDIIDSKGVPMRYIRIYTNNNTLVPGCFGQLVWGIHNLCQYFPGNLSDPSGTTKSAIGTSLANCYALECLEFECYFGNSSSGTKTATHYQLGSPKKLLIKDLHNYSASSSVGINYECNINEIDIYNISQGKISTIMVPSLKMFTIRNESDSTQQTTMFNQGSLSLSGGQTGTGTITYSSFINGGLEYLNLSGIKATAFGTTSDNMLPYKTLPLRTLILPLDMTTFYRRDFTRLSQLILPPTITTFYMGQIFRVGEVYFQSIPTTVQWSNIRCNKFVIPGGWNKTLPNFSYSLLRHDSLVDMLDNLADLTGSSAITITLGTYNLSLLSAEEKAIATNKNWTLA